MDVKGKRVRGRGCGCESDRTAWARRGGCKRDKVCKGENLSGNERVRA